jgi:hypothetical protein
MVAACPWLSQATAEAALGGVVIATNCDFTRGQDSLHIEVSERLASCPNAKPLKAIGTEAFTCGDDLIVGRVRDKAFLVRLKTKEPREKVRKIAELVAGSLF